MSQATQQCWHNLPVETPQQLQSKNASHFPLGMTEIKTWRVEEYPVDLEHSPMNVTASLKVLIQPTKNEDLVNLPADSEHSTKNVTGSSEHSPTSKYLKSLPVDLEHSPKDVTDYWTVLTQPTRENFTTTADQEYVTLPTRNGTDKDLESLPVDLEHSPTDATHQEWRPGESPSRFKTFS